MPGRISRKIIEDIVSEVDGKQLPGLIRRLRRRAEMASRMAESRARSGLRPDGSPAQPELNAAGQPVGEPDDVLLSKATRAQADVEEAVSRIRERLVKTDAAAAVLFEALKKSAAEKADLERPTVKIIEADVDERDKLQAEQATDVGATSGTSQ